MSTDLSASSDFDIVGFIRYFMNIYVIPSSPKSIWKDMEYRWQLYNCTARLWNSNIPFLVHLEQNIQRYIIETNIHVLKQLKYLRKVGVPKDLHHGQVFVVLI